MTKGLLKMVKKIRKKDFLWKLNQFNSGQIQVNFGESDESDDSYTKMEDEFDNYWIMKLQFKKTFFKNLFE